MTEEGGSTALFSINELPGVRVSRSFCRVGQYALYYVPMCSNFVPCILQILASPDLPYLYLPECFRWLCQ